MYSKYTVIVPSLLMPMEWNQFVANSTNIRVYRHVGWGIVDLILSFLSFFFFGPGERARASSLPGSIEIVLVHWAEKDKMKHARGDLSSDDSRPVCGKGESKVNAI